MEVSSQLHTLWEGGLGANWIGDWVGPRACLDAMVKRKVLISIRNQTLVIQPVS